MENEDYLTALQEIEENSQPNTPKTFFSTNPFNALQIEDNSPEDEVQYTRKSKKPSALTKKQSKILILSDSHGRHPSRKIKDKVGSKFNVMSFVKPKAPFEEVTKDLAAGNLREEYSKQDFIIVLGGTNNLKEKSQADVQVDLTNVKQAANFTNVLFTWHPTPFRCTGDKWKNKEDKLMNNKGG